MSQEEQVQQALATMTIQMIHQESVPTCFDKCFSKIDASFTNDHQICLAKCQDALLDAFDKVQEAIQEQAAIAQPAPSESSNQNPW